MRRTIQGDVFYTFAVHPSAPQFIHWKEGGGYVTTMEVTDAEKWDDLKEIRYAREFDTEVKCFLKEYVDAYICRVSPSYRICDFK